MTTLRFNDGMSFDTSVEPMRVTRRHDGLYVVGRGILCAVESYREGQMIVFCNELKVQRVVDWRVNDDASVLCGELINEVLAFDRDGRPCTVYVNEMYEIQWDVSGHTYNPEEE